MALKWATLSVYRVQGLQISWAYGTAEIWPTSASTRLQSGLSNLKISGSMSHEVCLLGFYAHGLVPCLLDKCPDSVLSADFVP